MKPQGIDDERERGEETLKRVVDGPAENKGEHSVRMPKGKEGAAALSAS